MIKLSNLAETIASNLIANNVLLAPKPNSVFSPIVGGMSLNLPEPPEDETEESLESIRIGFNKNSLASSRALGKSVSFEGLDLGYPSEEIMDKALAELRPIVVGTVTSLRDVVLPTVEEIFEKTYNEVAEQVHTGGVQLSVETDGSELNIWSNPVVRALADFKSVDINDNTPYFYPSKFGDVEETVIIDYVFGEDDLFNSELREAITHTGQDPETFILKVFNTVFKDKTKDSFFNPLEAIVAIILLSKFRENIPDGTEGMGLEQYRETLYILTNVYARRLNYALVTMQKNTASNYLVLEYPSAGSEYNDGATIIVNGRLYQSWLEKGGDVEHIYGAYCGAQYRDGEELLAQGDKLIYQWSIHLRHLQESRRDDFQRTYLDKLRRNIVEYCRNNDMQYSTAAITKLYDTMERLDENTVHRFTRNAVIDIMFPNRNYAAIADDIDRIMDKAPDMKVHDAVTLAIIDWLVKWALTHVKISN